MLKADIFQRMDKDDIHGRDELTVNMSTAGWSEMNQSLKAFLKKIDYSVCVGIIRGGGGHFMFLKLILIMPGLKSFK